MLIIMTIVTTRNIMMWKGQLLLRLCAWNLCYQFLCDILTDVKRTRGLRLPGG